MTGWVWTMPLPLANGATINTACSDYHYGEHRTAETLILLAVFGDMCYFYNGNAGLDSRIYIYFSLLRMYYRTSTRE